MKFMDLGYFEVKVRLRSGCAMPVCLPLTSSTAQSTG
jgi:hypothetical protein